MLRSFSFAILSLALLFAAPSSALFIDFEDAGIGHGTRIGDGPGYSLTVDNYAQTFDIAIAFDTNVTPSRDPDLQFQGQWAAGNIKDTNLGNILVLQENDNCNATTCAQPDDEGSRPAGSFLFNFGSTKYDTFSFDLVDVDSATAENGSITFFLDGTDAGNTVISFDFSALSVLDSSIDFRNRSANRIDLGLVGEFTAFEIVMGGSGGVDNILTGLHVVPEPTPALLLGLGLAGLTRVGRRRDR